jgi:hypothetical protein
MFIYSSLSCIELSTKFHCTILLILSKSHAKFWSDLKCTYNGRYVIFKLKVICDEAIHIVVHEMFAQQLLVDE